MTKEQMIRLSTAEILEVAKDLMFLVVADNATLASHRLGQCLSTLEKVQVRIMTDVLEQKDVLGPQESQMQIRALREQIATMEGGLAKVISAQGNWEESYWTMRDKFRTHLMGTNPELATPALLGPGRGEKADEPGDLS